jgi:hypothetical protein
MKKPLLKVLCFFVGREQGEKNNSVGRSYCVCGALKPEAGRKERELSLEDVRPPARPLLRAALNDAQSLGVKLGDGSKWTADEGNTYLSKLDSEVESFKTSS